MLTRKCAKNELFKAGDFNIRLTVFDHSPKFYLPKPYKDAWIATLRDSLGLSVINSKKFLHYRVTYISKKILICLEYHYTQGCELAEKISNDFDIPTSIRVDLILERKTLSWIILLPES